MTYLAWNTLPTLAQLAQAVETHPKPLYLIACLNEMKMPTFQASEQASALEKQLAQAITAKMSCLQFHAMNALQHIVPDVHFWLIPSAKASDLVQHFGENIEWQSDAVPQRNVRLKPWFQPPTAHRSTDKMQRPEHVIIIGAGIAGAATARFLADEGVKVTVLEARHAAGGGSGNRQGLLYAKISPHDTEQTELLLAGYGFTRRLLADLLPEQKNWGGNGVLHLNHNAAERRRNQALGEQHHHAHLYRSVSAQQAADIAGIEVFSDGLYWPQGVWLNPPSLVQKLLQHTLIDVHEHTPLLSATFDGSYWTAHTPHGDFRATHLIYCMGAHSPRAADRNISALPYRQIRGQTGVAHASPFSRQLQCALSGDSYISPSWENRHCYGATFVLNSDDEHWYPHEEQQNRQALQTLNAPLAQSLFHVSDGLNALQQAHGHAALRCDSLDHLPMVGAVGDIHAMQHVYAKLALDKNYRLYDNCPYLPNVYLNTAHGTRGLATAPICAASLTAEILGLPNPLSIRIRTALHPNRAVIRAIVRHQPLD